VGLYFGQYAEAYFAQTDEPYLVMVGGEGAEKEDFSRLVDWKIFDPTDCKDLVHCTVSGTDGDADSYIQLMVSKSEFVNINLLPVNEDAPMYATMSYRLINTEEQHFILQTLVFMAIGFAMLLVFVGLLFRALNPSDSSNR